MLVDVTALELLELRALNRYYARRVVQNMGILDNKLPQPRAAGEYDTRDVRHVFEREIGEALQAGKEVSRIEEWGEFPRGEWYCVQGEPSEQRVFVL